MSSFGDRVRIKESPETIAAGVHGLEGDVYGFTTPSVTSVVVIGGSPDDYALNVSVESHDAELWFRPDLVEFLHHNAGSEMIVGNTKAVRQADGSWVETRINGSPFKHARLAAVKERTSPTLWQRFARLFGSA